MQLQLVPASRGFAWMQQGIRTFGKRPVALLGLFMIFLLAMSILAMIPWIGLVLALALLPAVTLGFMSATRTVAHGDFPMPTVLLTAFRAGKEQLHGMLLLGGIYAMLFGASTVLVAPHHGGKGSSTPEFIDAVGARQVIFSAGYRNPFKHPHPVVLERYAASRHWRTDRDGALHLVLAPGVADVSAWRETHRRYWYGK